MTLLLSIFLTIVLLICLFFLSRSFANTFFKFWFLLTTSRIWAIRLSAFFLLPGTMFHELSHWFVAELLQVKTGEISLWPKVDETGEVRMGSVQIAKTDPFRRTIIGVAPLCVGLGSLAVLLTLVPLSFNQSLQTMFATLLTITGVFLISNTMFSSPKDLEAAFVPFAILVIVTLGVWWFDFSLPDRISAFLTTLLARLNIALFITILIDAVYLLIVQFSTWLFGKILKRRIVSR